MSKDFIYKKLRQMIDLVQELAGKGFVANVALVIVALAILSGGALAIFKTASKTKLYKNNTYGFQFSYPSNFILQEQTTNLGLPDELACPNVLRISLTDPNAPLIQFEAGSPAIKPAIVFNVRKASCYPEPNTTIDGLDSNAVLAGLQPTLDLHENIVSSLLVKGFSEKMSKIIALAIPSRGDGNPPVWVDQCSVGPVKANKFSVTYIKNTNCVMDGGVFVLVGGGVQTYYQTNVMIPFKTQNFFIDIRAGRDFYDVSGHNFIDPILKSFKIFKPLSVSPLAQKKDVPTSLSTINSQTGEWGDDKNGRHIGYIKKIYPQSGNNYLNIDYIQWIPCQPNQFGPGTCMNGFKIVNTNPKLRTFKISNTVVVMTQTQPQGGISGPLTVVLLSYLQNLVNQPNSFWNTSIPFWIDLNKGVVTTITEQYVP